MQLVSTWNRTAEAKLTPSPCDEASADTLVLTLGSYRASTVGCVNSSFNLEKALSCSVPQTHERFEDKMFAKWLTYLG